MSEANLNYIIKHNKYINKKDINICPNSVKLDNIENKNKVDKNKIRIEYGIPNDKIVFIYGGNLGKPQGVDFLLNCIEINEGSSEAFFVIVGSGTEYGRIKNFFELKKPNNAILIQYLEKNKYDELLETADVGLIFLDKRFTIPNFPSRILSYMEKKLPVIAATDTNTDIGKIILDGKFGFWCESGDKSKFSEYVNLLLNKDLRRAYGNNAYNYLVSNYTIEKTYNAIIQIDNQEVKH